MVHFFPADQNASVIENNWAYKSSKGCYRFDDPYDGASSNLLCPKIS